MIVSFRLTMPNVGSWNGRWSGAERKYYVVRKFSDIYMKSKDHFKELLDNGSDSWYYSWNDGWGANVTAEIIGGNESRKRMRVSAGFCGYDWMIDSICMYGKIYASHERPKEMMSSEQNPEECDATEDDSSNAAG